MKGIKPTSYLNNMIIYTNPQPAGGRGETAACRGCCRGNPPAPQGQGEAGCPAHGELAHACRSAFALGSRFQSLCAMRGLRSSHSYQP